MDTESIISATVKIVRAHLLSEDYKIFLFGSWAKGNALKTSDIDIGILGKEELPWDSMVNILNEIETIPTLRKIDVVDLTAKEKSFRDNVLRYAKAL